MKSSPTIGPDGRIYVTNGEVPGGYLYCVNPDGTVAWRLYLGAEANSIPCFGTDGVIYVGSERHLNAVDPDGTFRWRFSVFYPIQGPVGIAGSQIFFSAWDGMVRAVNLSGQLLWQSPMGSILESGIAHTSNRVYVTSNIRELYAYNHFGSLQWVHGGNYRASTPAVGADGVIYAVGGVGSLVYALNPANGLVRWVYGSQPRTGTVRPLLVQTAQSMWSTGTEHFMLSVHSTACFMAAASSTTGRATTRIKPL